MSELDPDGTRLLRYLISRIPTVDPDDMNSYVTYGEAHSALNLFTMGNTTGMSLRHQGLDSLAEWAITEGKPAITGLIIDGGSLEPGGGFFRAYGKENAPDQYTWWVDQIRLVKQHDWAGELSGQSAVVSSGIPITSAKTQNNDADDEGPSQPPEKETVTVTRVVRDSALTARVKQLHDWKCQLCGHTIVLPDGSKYAEGHHVVPLGAPHGGLDVMTNIMCVCPNHHVELDYGVISISPKDLRRVAGHDLGEEFIRYHNEHIYGRLAGDPTPHLASAVSTGSGQLR